MEHSIGMEKSCIAMGIGTWRRGLEMGIWVIGEHHSIVTRVVIGLCV